MIAPGPGQVFVQVASGCHAAQGAVTPTGRSRCAGGKPVLPEDQSPGGVRAARPRRPYAVFNPNPTGSIGYRHRRNLVEVTDARRQLVVIREARGYTPARSSAREGTFLEVGRQFRRGGSRLRPLAV